jgi:hypothetical protein
MKDAGFPRVEYFDLTFGIVTVYVGDVATGEIEVAFEAMNSTISSKSPS